MLHQVNHRVFCAIFGSNNYQFPALLYTSGFVKLKKFNQFDKEGLIKVKTSIMVVM